MTLKTLIASDVGDVFLNTSEFAEACQWRTGAEQIAVTLIRDDESGLRGGNWHNLPVELATVARLQRFYGAVADLAIGGEPFLPAADHEIDWTDENGATQTSVVFPLNGPGCYRFTDSARAMFAAFAVQAADLCELIYRSPTGDGATYWALAGVVSARQEDEAGLLIASSIAAENVTERRMVRIAAHAAAVVEAGTCTVNGDEWAIEEIVAASGTMVDARLIRVLRKRHHQARTR